MKAAVLLVLFLALALSSCRPPEGRDGGGASSTPAGGLQVQIEPENPPAVGTSPLRVTVQEGGQPVTGARVELTGTMTHAGMSPVIVMAAEAEPGVYLAEDFEFTMAGDWILIADVTLPGGAQERAQTALSVPGD